MAVSVHHTTTTSYVPGNGANIISKRIQLVESPELGGNTGRPSKHSSMLEPGLMVQPKHVMMQNAKFSGVVWVILQINSLPTNDGKIKPS